METRLPGSDLGAVHGCFKHQHADERFYALAETLLWRNEALRGPNDVINEPSARLNPSQLAFATIAMLDLQVPNGGLMQFFWNCPGWVDHVPASLRAVGLTELAKAFEQSIEELLAQSGTFSEFRKHSSLEAYSKCAAEFNFDAFDSSYFGQGEELYEKSIAFVSQHFADFIA